jgi:hypothetical protein
MKTNIIITKNNGLLIKNERKSPAEDSTRPKFIEYLPKM